MYSWSMMPCPPNRFSSVLRITRYSPSPTVCACRKNRCSEYELWKLNTNSSFPRLKVMIFRSGSIHRLMALGSSSSFFSRAIWIIASSKSFSHSYFRFLLSTSDHCLRQYL